MRIDPTHGAAAQVEIANTAVHVERVQRAAEASVRTKVEPLPEKQAESAPARPVPLPQPNQLSVSVDDKQNVIYRITDPNNGKLVRQVPPEEILRIVRSIEDLLHEPEQKLKVAL